MMGFFFPSCSNSETKVVEMLTEPKKKIVDQHFIQFAIFVCLCTCVCV